MQRELGLQEGGLYKVWLYVLLQMRRNGSLLFFCNIEGAREVWHILAERGSLPTSLIFQIHPPSFRCCAVASWPTI